MRHVIPPHLKFPKDFFAERDDEFMGFRLTMADYMEFLRRAFSKINENGEYITSLDAATGDGDHWVNLNGGLEKVVAMADELGNLSFFDAFKKIGMTMMSSIGGSGGVLYGSAYLEAAKVLKEHEYLESSDICDILSAMCSAIMNRGKSEPGMKTMLDSLYPAVETYKAHIAAGSSEAETLAAVKNAAIDGANSTKDMEAVKGRAYYQGNRGVGHLDPGAVTMSYQIETLMDFLTEKL